VPWSLPASNVTVRWNLVPGASVIFEIGGNVGYDLEQYVNRFPAAKLWSFEPVPELYNTLQTKFGSNPNVTIQQVGVSNSDGNTTFVVAGAVGEACVSER